LLDDDRVVPEREILPSTLKFDLINVSNIVFGHGGEYRTELSKNKDGELSGYVETRKI
jgi:hypothetical protein